MVVRAVAKAMRSVKAVTREVKQLFDEVSRQSGLAEAHEEIVKQTTLIRGDDGKYYESYRLGSGMMDEGMKDDRMRDDRMSDEKMSDEKMSDEKMSGRKA